MNLWGATEPMRKRLELIAEALAARADIVLLQEVASMQSSESSARWLSKALGFHCCEKDTGKEGFGLAILTRDKLAETVAVPLPAPGGYPRWLLSGRIAGANLWVHCTHLMHGLDSGLWREKQVVALSRAIEAYGPGVQVLGGDFNAREDSDEIRYLRGLCTLDGHRSYFQDAWRRHWPHEAGNTWCMLQGAARAERSIDVDLRLDYLFVSKRLRSGEGTIEGCERFLDQTSADGVTPSDHCALVATVIAVSSETSDE